MTSGDGDQNGEGEGDWTGNGVGTEWVSEDNWACDGEAMWLAKDWGKSDRHR